MVDILLATYNGEKFLEEQMNSLLNQSYGEIRIIVRDDGSSDRTVQIIQKYVEAHPQKVIFIQDDVKCGNPTKNFMELIKYAASPYVMLCDQDDFWLPEKVEITLDCMKKVEHKNVDQLPILVYTDYSIVDENLKPINVDERKMQIYNHKLELNRLLVQNYVTGCTIMMNRELYVKVHNYYPEVMMHDWWFAIYASCFGKIEHFPIKTMLYRQHNDNCVGATDVKSFRYRLGKMKDPNVKHTMNLYYRQAERFVSEFSMELNNSSNKMILKRFLDIPKYNKLGRIYWVLRGEYLKGDFVRILGQLFYI